MMKNKAIMLLALCNSALYGSILYNDLHNKLIDNSQKPYSRIHDFMALQYDLGNPQKKLGFIYGPMKADKSATIIDICCDLYERNAYPLAGPAYWFYAKNVAVLISDIVKRDHIYSRNNCSKTISAKAFSMDADLAQFINKKNSPAAIDDTETRIIIIDEAQFLTQEQVEQLETLLRSEEYNIKKIYVSGLLYDYKGNQFPASTLLTQKAHMLIRKTADCELCNKKRIATRNILADEKSKAAVKDGNILIGEHYLSVCENCFEAHSNEQAKKGEQTQKT